MTGLIDATTMGQEQVWFERTSDSSGELTPMYLSRMQRARPGMPDPGTGSMQREYMFYVNYLTCKYPSDGTVPDVGDKLHWDAGLPDNLSAGVIDRSLHTGTSREWCFTILEPF